MGSSGLFDCDRLRRVELTKDDQIGQRRSNQLQWDKAISGGLVSTPQCWSFDWLFQWFNYFWEEMLVDLKKVHGCDFRVRLKQLQDEKVDLFQWNVN